MSKKAIEYDTHYMPASRAPLCPRFLKDYGDMKEAGFSIRTINKKTKTDIRRVTCRQCLQNIHEITGELLDELPRIEADDGG
jgi:hypothetical protein